MIGVPSRLAAALAAAVGLLSAPALPAQTSSPDDAPSVSVTPDATPVPPPDASSVLPPYAPSNNAASPLLPSSPPLPPRPSVPDPTLLPPGATPPPAAPPAQPVLPQTIQPLPPANTGVLPASGNPGIAPSSGADALGQGATTTTNTGAVRRFQYAFGLSTGVTYDDNVFLTPNDPTPLTNAAGTASRRHFSRSDVYFSVTPSISLGYGDFISRATNYVEFDYNANALIYAQNTDQDTIQHSVALQGAYHFAQVTLTLSQSVQILDSTDLSAANPNTVGTSTTATTTNTAAVNLDTSQRTRLNVYGTSLNANYALSDKTSFDLGGSLNVSDYETLISSDTLGGSAYFNYSPTGKITLGVGVSAGYIIQDESAPDEEFEQINLRLSYAATSKLTVSGSVGVQFRETNGVGGTDVTPVFDLAVSYAPFDGTSLSLAASRSVQTSAVLTGENFDSTGFTFNVSQSLFQRATAHLSVGYTYSNYVFSGTGLSASRTDDYYFVQPGLDYTIRSNISAGIFYIHRQSSSSLLGNSFSDNQIGARLTLSF